MAISETYLKEWHVNYTDGSTPTFETQLAAANAASGGGTVILHKGTHTLTAARAVDADVTLVCDYGAIITGSYALTVNGKFMAGEYQCFTSQPTVTFAAGAVSTVYPEWWGAVYGNTTDYAAAVQSAISSISAGTVQFNGMVSVGAASWVGLTMATKSNINLKGNHRGCGIKILVQPSQAAATGISAKALLKLTSCSNVVISGMEFDGNAIQALFIGMTSCSHCTIEKNYFHGNDNTGPNEQTRTLVSVSGSHNIFDGNRLYDTGGGFWLGNTNSDAEVDLTVTNNFMDTLQGTAIGGTWQRALIQGNTAKTSTAGSGVAMGAADSTQTYDVRIVNNYFSGMAFHGIQADSVDNTLPNTNITVSNNHCYGNAMSGIYIAQPSTNWVVTGNVCYDNNSDNSGSTDAGIYIFAGATYSTEIKNIVVADNLCYNVAGYQKMGIYIQAYDVLLKISGIVVKGNICYGNQVNGIQLAKASTGSMTDIQLIGNHVFSNTTRGITINATVTNLVVVGNRSHDNGTDDYRNDNAAGGAICGDNIFGVYDTVNKDYKFVDVVRVAASTGAGTIKMGSGTAANSAGFVPLKIDNTTVYVPYFTNAAP